MKCQRCNQETKNGYAYYNKKEGGYDIICSSCLKKIKEMKR